MKKLEKNQFNSRRSKNKKAYQPRKKLVLKSAMLLTCLTLGVSLGAVTHQQFNLSSTIVHADTQTVTVTYDSKGGTTVPSQSLSIGAKFQRPQDPTRAGYTFACWNTAPDGSGTDYRGGESVTANLTLYAQWSQNMATFTVPNQSEAVVGTPVDLLKGMAGTDTAGNPFNFAQPNPYFTGKIEVYESNGMIASQGWLDEGYSSFTPSYADTYTIKYWANAGFGNNAVNLTATQTLVVTQADKIKTTISTAYSDENGNDIKPLVSKPSPDYTNYPGASLFYMDLPTIPGYTFKEVIGATLSEDMYIATFGDTNKTVTFVYSKNADPTPPAKTQYSVSFISNGGTVIDSPMVDDGDLLTKPTDPTKTGYTFAGWYTDQDLTQAYDFSSPVTSNLILYAKWTETTAPTPPAKTQYSVSYISNGGTVIAASSVTDGELLTKPTDPTKSGYTFAGWFTDQNLTQAYDFSSPVTSNLILHAKWVVNKVVSPESKPSTNVPAPTVNKPKVSESKTTTTKATSTQPTALATKTVKKAILPKTGETSEAPLEVTGFLTLLGLAGVLLRRKY